MGAVSGDNTERALVAPGVKPPLAVPRRLLRMRSDAALAERYAAGDNTAFDVLYERHRPVVLAVSMGVLGVIQDAEDATQETFSALAVALRTKPPAELRPWLIRVSRNASIDTTRRRRHRLLTLDGEIPEVAARPAGAGKAELAVVLDGIRELPEGQRMALLMRELGGHSYAEIAEFLEVDEEAVKGLIARARVGLRAFREAAELTCASARVAIESEPDGRRYDKSVRRHIHGCASCRAYRAALRDDAKRLRAALPLQAGAGAIASGGMTTGILTAGKGAALVGYGLTQAAATCAASACAVGAIGGMVLVAPVHKLGISPFLSAPAPAATHITYSSRPAAKPKAAAPAPTHTATTLAAAPQHHAVPASAAPASAAPAGTAGRPAVTTASHHRVHAHRPVHVTRVQLPATLAALTHTSPAAAATITPPTRSVSAVHAPVQAPSAPTTSTVSAPATSTPATSTPATSAPATSTPATSAPATSTPAASAPPASTPSTSTPPVSTLASSTPTRTVYGSHRPGSGFAATSSARSGDRWQPGTTTSSTAASTAASTPTHAVAPSSTPAAVTSGSTPAASTSSSAATTRPTHTTPAIATYYHSHRPPTVTAPVGHGSTTVEHGTSSVGHGTSPGLGSAPPVSQAAPVTHPTIAPPPTSSTTATPPSGWHGSSQYQYSHPGNSYGGAAAQQPSSTTAKPWPTPMHMPARP